MTQPPSTHRTALIVLCGAAAFITLVALTRPDAAIARRVVPLGSIVFGIALALAASGGTGVLRIAHAMLRKISLTYISYRTQLVSIFLYATLTIALFVFAGGPFLRLLFNEASSNEGQAFSQYVVLLVVVGFTTWPIFWRSWELTALGVRQEQWEGTFESMIPMPGAVRALPFGYLWSRLVFTVTFQLAILAAISYALPDSSLQFQTLGAIVDFAAVLVLTILCMWGMGLLFGGLAVLYKQVGPIDLAVRTMFLFLAGIFVPLNALPPWGQALAKALPLTYSFELLRSIAVDGVPLAETSRPLMMLLGFTLLFVIAGNLLYVRYVEKARRHGAVQGY